MMLANLSLRTILVAAFTALVIGAAGTVGWLSYHAGQRAVTVLADQLIGEIGDRIDQRLARYLAALRYLVDGNAALIRQGRLDPSDIAALEGHFAAQLGLFPGVFGIGLVTERRESLLVERQAPDALILRRFDAATGWRLLRYRADLEGNPGELIESRQNYDPHNDPPGRPWYPAAKAVGEGSWRLSVSLGKGQNKPVLISFYALPFKDAQGTVQGVLAASMTLTGMSEFLQGLRVSTHGQALLIDREGLLLATSTGEMPFDSRARTDHAQNVAVETRRLPAIASTDPLTREVARQLLARQPALERLATPLSFDFDFSGHRYLAKVASSSDLSHPDWLTLVVAPQGDFTALIAAHLHQPVLFAGLGLLIAMLLGLVAAALISRPLGQLSAATRRLAAGDFDQPMPPAPIRELRELGESFGRMTLRLRDAFADLRAAEQALAEDNQRLERKVAERTAQTRNILDHLPTAIGASRLGAEQRMLYLNQQFVRTFGYTPEDIPTVCEWAIRAYPDEGYRTTAVDWWNAALARATPQRGSIESREFRVTSKDGTVRDVVISATVLDDLLITSFEDITERKRAEVALRFTKERLEATLNALPELMLRLDSAGRILEVHAPHDVQFPLAPHGLLGKRCHVEQHSLTTRMGAF